MNTKRNARIVSTLVMFALTMLLPLQGQAAENHNEKVFPVTGPITSPLNSCPARLSINVPGHYQENLLYSYRNSMKSIPSSQKLDPFIGGVMDFYHSGVDSSVHIVDHVGTPPIGQARFHFPAMTENITITANGVELVYSLSSDLNSSTTLFADVNIPPGTISLILEYDQLDSAIAFEGLWYLAYDWIFGPTTMIIHLPTDASILRYEGASFATLIDSHTLRFDVPDGAFYPTVVYSTTNVPNLYNTIITPHLRIFMPSVYAPFNDTIASLLENGYDLYSQYSGLDVNQLANQERYDFYFPPGGWYWWGSTITLWGGLTVLGGPSAVSSRFLPNAKLTVSASYNTLMAMMFHELGNGWWLLMHNGGLPWWIHSEAHSGFLRSQAELDLNYCADAQREHQNHYQEYLQCMQTQPEEVHCNPEIIMISLLQKYGWQPFRNIYASVWNGSLNLNGLSDDEKDSQMALFFSQQVNENLVAFLRSQRIYVSPAVENALSGLPVGNVPIISSLSCHPLSFRYWPSSLEFIGTAGQQDIFSRILYVSAPTEWTATISPPVDWLLIERNSVSNNTFLTVHVDTSGLSLGSYSTTVKLTSQPAISNSPIAISVDLAIRHKINLPLILNNMIFTNLVQNPGFEDGSYNPFQAPPYWVKDLFLSTANLSWDNTQAHSGSKSLFMESLSANDVRWIQTIPVYQNANYILSGWIKTMNVAHSDGSVVAGANLGLFGTWDHTPGLFGTNDWTFVSMDFNSGNNTNVTVACRLGYWSGTATGTVWCDDINLRLK